MSAYTPPDKMAAPAAVASPLTKLQRKAIAVCFTSDKVSVSEVQRKLSISYADAQTLCQSIVDLGLTDELELAPSLKQRGAPAPHPAPVAQGDATRLKDGDIAALVNRLRDIAIEYSDTQQLRERIASEIRPRAAGLVGGGINKIDSQRILELTAQLAEAKADNERLRAANIDCVYHFEVMKDDLAEAQKVQGQLLHALTSVMLCEFNSMSSRAEMVRIARAAIDAAKGESNA